MRMAFNLEVALPILEHWRILAQYQAHSLFSADAKPQRGG
jgi:hypothetical protein